MFISPVVELNMLELKISLPERKLYEKVKDLFSKDEQKKLQKVVKEGNDFSIRTREVNGKVKLVLKASVGDDTSANGVSRIEFDEEVEGKTLDELDKFLLDAGFTYQAKWSRSRKEYVCNNTNVCIDKNAGYGYVAEFEKVVPDKNEQQAIEQEIRDFMKELECEELRQERLERMFAHYNENWPDYYGTDKTFVVE